MRFGVLIVAAAAAGIVGTVAIPTTFLQRTSAAVQSFFGGFKVADLNPLRAVFDYDQAQIMKGNTPESLGFKPAPLVITGFPIQRPYQGLTNNPGYQNGQTTTWQNPSH